ncbi:FAD-dependent oxidoreductase [Herbiconiux sp. P16]|uniref:FAD-dependent oxidoreductase n=1 Tax=Herbiconiux wuyangfengii TaxID=3342794 RepID=UPI0035B9CB7D
MRTRSALSRCSDGYSLRFADGETATAYAVILALPFCALRRVNTEDVGFSDGKQAIIRELEMGTVAKLLMQFDGRVGSTRRTAD